jgi:hypothetical protein
MNDENCIWEAYQHIYESVTFSIAEELQVTTMSHLSFNLLYKTKASEFVKSNLTDEEMKTWEQKHHREFIAMDGLEPDDTEGNINFYTVGLPERIIPKIVSFIKYHIEEYNFKLTSEPYREKSKKFESDVIRFPVQINQIFEKIPEVNLANTTTRIILIDLLQYPESVLRDYEKLNAREFLIKIETVEDDERRIQSSTTKTSTNNNFTSLGLTEERIKRILSELKRLAQYAIDNHFSYIQIS